MLKDAIAATHKLNIWYSYYKTVVDVGLRIEVVQEVTFYTVLNLTID